jgi:hypothetical protein
MWEHESWDEGTVVDHAPWHMRNAARGQTLRMIPVRAPAPRPSSPSCPALVADVEPTIDAGAVSQFRRGTTPWTALGAIVLVASILGGLLLTSEKAIPGRMNVAAAPPPPAAMDLPAPVPAPPPTGTSIGVPSDAAHPYDADRDPAMKYRAPESWLGPKPQPRKR